MGGWGGLHSDFRVKPTRCVRLCWGWGFDKNEVCKTVIQTQEVSRKKGSFSDQIVISDKESEREMTPYYTHKIFDKLKPKQTT